MRCISVYVVMFPIKTNGQSTATLGLYSCRVPKLAPPSPHLLANFKVSHGAASVDHSGIFIFFVATLLCMNGNRLILKANERTLLLRLVLLGSACLE